MHIAASSGSCSPNRKNSHASNDNSPQLRKRWLGMLTHVDSHGRRVPRGGLQAVVERPRSGRDEPGSGRTDGDRGAAERSTPSELRPQPPLGRARHPLQLSGAVLARDLAQLVELVARPVERLPRHGAHAEAVPDGSQELEEDLRLRRGPDGHSAGPGRVGADLVRGVGGQRVEQVHRAVLRRQRHGEAGARAVAVGRDDVISSHLAPSILTPWHYSKFRIRVPDNCHRRHNCRTKMWQQYRVKVRGHAMT